MRWNAEAWGLAQSGNSSAAQLARCLLADHLLHVVRARVAFARAALDRLAEDRDLLARMSATALESFRERPSWARSMAEIERFLEGVTKLSRK